MKRLQSNVSALELKDISSFTYFSESNSYLSYRYFCVPVATSWSSTRRGKASRKYPFPLNSVFRRGILNFPFQVVKVSCTEHGFLVKEPVFTLNFWLIILLLIFLFMAYAWEITLTSPTACQHLQNQDSYKKKKRRSICILNDWPNYFKNTLLQQRYLYRFFCNLLCRIITNLWNSKVK